MSKPCMLLFVFFFQAEDGIRDLTVTGVQTCALPIFIVKGEDAEAWRQALAASTTPLSPGARKALRVEAGRPEFGVDIDRKSTRLNSSHSQISYAVFCLKKKKKKKKKKRSKKKKKKDK